jgi:hypothetical protein
MKQRHPGLLLSAFTAILLGVMSIAAHAQAARGRDLRSLQTELTRLDEALDALPAENPRRAEFERRAQDLRDDVTWLEGQMRQRREDPSRGDGATVEKVQQVQQSAAALRRDIDATLDRAAQPDAGRDAEIPAGTEFEVSLDQPLSSRTARIEDRAEATTLDPIMVAGREVVPAGTPVSGIVTDVQTAERVQKDGRLTLDFRSLDMEGAATSIRTTVVSVSEQHSGGSSAKKGGLGALLGGVIGGVIGGKEGVLLGAVVGGGGTLAATKGENVELPEGTVLRLRFTETARLGTRN